MHVNTEPPQSVSVQTASDTLTVTWKEPISGLTNDPVLAYKIECSTTSAGNDEILYTARSKVTNTTTSIIIPVANFISTSLSNYNCCVEAVLETYSSIACTTSERSVIMSTIQPSCVAICFIHTIYYYTIFVYIGRAQKQSGLTPN